MEDFYNAKVREIMILGRDVPFIEENAIWAELLAKLSLRAHVWVVNNTKDMSVVGIVTEHDMLRYIMPPSSKKERLVGISKTEILHAESIVRDIMTSTPVVCAPEETVDDILKKISSFNIRRLAVVDEHKKLLGEITVQLLVKNLRYKFMHTV